MQSRTEVFTVLDGVTATTTSNKLWVGNAKRIGFQFTRADHSSGSTAFTVNGSLDDENTVTPTMDGINMIISNATNTNGETLTRVATVTLSADGTEIHWLDPICVLNWINVVATETTDGTHTAKVILQY